MIINFSDETINLNKDMKKIFLAGPTLRNSSFDLSWRKYACEYLKNIGFNGIIYVPEFKNNKNPIDFLNQAGWEREGLMNSDIIVFYIPRKFPELPGLTTNVEFGTYIVRKPESVLLCCPPEGEKNRYIEWLYKEEKPGSLIYRSLEDVLTAAIALI